VLLCWTSLSARAGEPSSTWEDLRDAPTPQALEAVEQRIVGQGCEPRLLGDARRRFVEAQLLCDAYLSFILVQATLEGSPLPDSRRRLKALLTDALGRARAPFLADGTTRVADRALPLSILYRGHVLLMLAGMHRAGLAAPEDSALFDALAAQLVEALSRQRLLPSFGRSIWPCDSAPAAAGLLLHGQLRGADASTAMGERLVERLVELTTLPTGFPTRVDAKGRPVEATPRGTALAWTGAYLGMAGHPAASTFTSTLVRTHCDRPAGDLLPLAACREWPRGVHGKEDAASGPLLHGYSVGASALAIAATHLSAEHTTWHRQLLNTAREMGIHPMLQKPDKHPLEATLFWWGLTTRPWASVQ